MTNQGHTIYSKKVLSIYDFWVLGISNHMIWKCPTKKLLKHFSQNLSSNHLDVGVGSGYFLDHCIFPMTSVRLALMDLNPHSLAKTAERIRRYSPECYIQNILEPLSHHPPHFDSISLNYVLHCLPGSISSKAVIFDHLSKVLSPSGKVFGSTLLRPDEKTSFAARKLMRFYNRKKIFSNENDSFEDLQACLSKKYESYQIQKIGCVALFSATKKK